MRASNVFQSMPAGGRILCSCASRPTPGWSGGAKPTANTTGTRAIAAQVDGARPLSGRTRSIPYPSHPADGVRRLRPEARLAGILLRHVRHRAGALGHRRQGDAAADLQSARRPGSFAHSCLRQRLELQVAEAGGLRARRGGGGETRIHRAQVRPGAGPLADVHSERPHQARGKGDARGARRRRPRRRPSARHPPPAGADACHRSCQCAGRVRAILVRRTLSVRKRRSAWPRCGTQAEFRW